jgi:hypothetical protein
MSALHTRILLPGMSSGAGLMDWDRQTPEEMIRQLRRYYQKLHDDAVQILAAQDHEFQVDVIRGSIVQHHVQTLQQSSRKS